MRYVVLFAAVLALSACGGDSGTGINFSDTKPLDLPQSAYTETASGLFIYDIVVGTGALPTARLNVAVEYEGWLVNGTKFDSSRDRGEPFIFAVGAGQVIAGWDEGVSTMRFGGRRQLVIPPSLAYGENSAGGGLIPPNSVLIFDIELLPQG
mgnify:CR=1 FL=1